MKKEKRFNKGLMISVIISVIIVFLTIFGMAINDCYEYISYYSDSYVEDSTQNVPNNISIKRYSYILKEFYKNDYTTEDYHKLAVSLSMVYFDDKEVGDISYVYDEEKGIKDYISDLEIAIKNEIEKNKANEIIDYDEMAKSILSKVNKESAEREKNLQIYNSSEQFNNVYIIIEIFTIIIQIAILIYFIFFIKYQNIKQYIRVAIVFIVTLLVVTLLSNIIYGPVIDIIKNCMIKSLSPGYITWMEMQGLNALEVEPFSNVLCNVFTIELFHILLASIILNVFINI